MPQRGVGNVEGRIIKLRSVRTMIEFQVGSRFLALTVPRRASPLLPRAQTYPRFARERDRPERPRNRLHGVCSPPVEQSFSSCLSLLFRQGPASARASLDRSRSSTGRTRSSLNLDSLTARLISFSSAESSQLARKPARSTRLGQCDPPAPLASAAKNHSGQAAHFDIFHRKRARSPSESTLRVRLRAHRASTMDSSAPPAERSPSSETAPLSRATSRSKSPSSQRLVEEEDRTHASSSKPNGRSERGRKLPVSRKKSRTTTRRAVPRAVTPSDAATSDDDATNQLDTAQAKNTPTRHTSSPLSDYNDKSPSIPLASSSLRPNDAAPSSTHSTPAPAKTVTPAGSSDESDNSQGFSSKLAPRGRGRPKGRKFPNPKTTTRRPTASAPSSVGRNSPVADFLPTPRATRATVALPPGYIEGVKSTRMPRAVSVRAESSGIDEDVKPKKWIKGKEREVPKEIEVEEVVPEKMLLTVEVKNLPQLPAIVKSPETSPVCVSLVHGLLRRAHYHTLQRNVGRSKRTRPLETPQRNSDCSVNWITKLHSSTTRRIPSFSTRTLVSRWRRPHDCRNCSICENRLRCRLIEIWRWKRKPFGDSGPYVGSSTYPASILTALSVQDAKDTLRMELYLANHDHLKQLISEEREYPFSASMLPCHARRLLTYVR